MHLAVGEMGEEEGTRTAKKWIGSSLEEYKLQPSRCVNAARSFRKKSSGQKGSKRGGKDRSEGPRLL